MPNAFSDSDNIGNSLAEAPLGAGMAQGAARLRKIWQDEYTNGATELQFPEWLKAQGVKNPIMPR